MKFVHWPRFQIGSHREPTNDSKYVVIVKPTNLLCVFTPFDTFQYYSLISWNGLYLSHYLISLFTLEYTSKTRCRSTVFFTFLKVSYRRRAVLQKKLQKALDLYRVYVVYCYVIHRLLLLIYVPLQYNIQHNIIKVKSFFLLNDLDLGGQLAN